MHFAYLLTGILLLTVHSVRAKDFSDEPYLLRLFFSLESSSNYSDTAARLASVAAPLGSSANPAASSSPSKRGREQSPLLTATTINAVSESGTWITAAAVTSTVHTESLGTFSPAYAYTDTIDSTNESDLDNTLDSHEFFLGWSKALNDSLLFGIQARYVTADISSESFSASLGGAPLRTDNDLTSKDVTIGFLGTLNDSVYAGATVSLGWTDVETEAKNLVPVGLVPRNTVLVDRNDDVRTRGVKLGIGYEPRKDLGIYFDVQYSEVDPSGEDHVSLKRAALGLEYEVTPNLTLLTGARVDSESEVTVAAGVGYQINKDAVFNLAYQRNGAPEIEQEFGRMDFLNASLAIQL